jgi:biotin synthase
MEHAEILNWLREDDSGRLDWLYRRADLVRREQVGDAVHMRGLVEFSNYCARQCGYCGLRRGNRLVTRYRMTDEQILDCARLAAELGYGTVVLQSGEDYGITTEWLAGVIRRVKGETGLAVTLSVGEFPERDLAAWREAGADRYLLRFETSDPELYAFIHPPFAGKARSRIEMLKTIHSLGYETGSGVMIGIPGQSYESLVHDIETFQSLDLDMIGMGPYIPHPETPLGRGERLRELPASEQVPNTEEMVYKMVALTRIACPQANIPSTTALATLNLSSGRELGLQRGANVVMPNLTPVEYRAFYEIYPNKACIRETASGCATCLHGRIAGLGRTLGNGPGARSHETICA